jgi:hypothetical protein
MAFDGGGAHKSALAIHNDLRHDMATLPTEGALAGLHGTIACHSVPFKGRFILMVLAAPAVLMIPLLISTVIAAGPINTVDD